MLPVAGVEVLCRCGAAHCQEARQQITFKWRQATADCKVGEPRHKVMASIAAVTHSQVSQPAPNAAGSELPASSMKSDSDSQETAPAADLSHFQKRCANAYEPDLNFGISHW